MQLTPARHTDNFHLLLCKVYFTFAEPKLTFMNLLLPHRFKKIGVLIAPTGFALWLAMQMGYVTKACTLALGPQANSNTVSPYHTVSVATAVIGFLSFLAGLYFLTFSKEKKEDEMVQRTRLDSFQFAALAQMAIIILGFVLMLLFGDPSEGGLMLFFIAVIFLFWLTFIGRFNYILHVRLRK